MILSQIRLLTGNFQQSMDFYKEIMGFPVAVYVKEMPYASFKAGKINIELLSRSGMADIIGEAGLPAEGELQSKFLLDVEVENVDEAYALLKDRGAKFVNEPHDRKEWDARVVHLRDPDGNVIELYKHPL